MVRRAAGAAAGGGERGRWTAGKRNGQSRLVRHPIAILPLVALAAAPPAQLVWERTQAPAMPPFTSGALAFDAGAGRVLLFGGDPVRGFAATWSWDGSAWTQLAPAGQPTPRELHGMAYDRGRGRIVLFGGEEPGPRRLADTWEWDGATWLQRTSPTAPAPRTWFAMAHDSWRRRTVLYGGDDGTPVPLTDTWEWDGVAWARRQPVPFPRAVYPIDMAFDEARGICVMLLLAVVGIEHWQWDGESWEQRFPPRKPSARARLVFDAARGSVVAIDEAVLWQWDGSEWLRRALPNAPPRGAIAQGAAYDAARNRIVVGWAPTHELSGATWVAVPPPRSTPTRGAVAQDPVSGAAMLFDGRRTWRWAVAGWLELQPATAPPPRLEPALADDAGRGRVLLFGGWDGSQFLGDTWEWDGSDWVEHFPAISPPPNTGHAMAYDPVRRRVVLWGGLRAAPATTWEWDGSAWSAVATPRGPSDRARSAMAFDAASRRVLLFGGLGTGVLGDTWAFDGLTWTQLFPTRSPRPRALHGMTYDATRQRVVLAGGYDAAGIAPGSSALEFWDWDGAEWTGRAPALNPPHLEGASASVAYDAERGAVIGFTDALGTWQYATAFPAVFEPFGSGCAGTAGVPVLANAGGQLPWLASAFTFELRQLPPGPGAAAFLVLGASRTSWAGAALPLSLAPLGWLGCQLWTSADSVVPLVNAGGAASWSVVLPAGAELWGARLYAQGLVLDAAANPGGAALSNAGATTLGAR